MDKVLTTQGKEEMVALRRRVAELEARVADAAANERVLRTLLDTLPDSLYVKDCQRRKVLSNQMDVRYMGAGSEREALGRTDDEFYAAEEAAHFRDQDMLVLSGFPIVNHEERLTLGGETQWLLTTKVPIRDDAGDIVGILGVGRNITALRQALDSSDRLLAANQALEQASQLKDEFLANISHELRTPLTGVLAMAEALQGDAFGPLNERQRRLLQRIEMSGRHLLNIINDLLDVSRLDAGTLELIRVDVALDALCRACVQSVATAAAAKQQTVHLCIEPQTMTISADPRRLRQILVNLLDNAVKFTPEGGSVGLHVTGNASGGTVRFVVWDTGIGIAADDQGRLFQPFSQLDASLSRNHAGTGLGLLLVRRLAELHGGQVSAESILGNGSRFVVTLPWHSPSTEIRSMKGD